LRKYCDIELLSFDVDFNSNSKKKRHIESAILNFLTKQSFSFSKNIYATGLRVLRRQPFHVKNYDFIKMQLLFLIFLYFRRHIEKSGDDSEKRITGTERAEKIQ